MNIDGFYIFDEGEQQHIGCSIVSNKKILILFTFVLLEI